MSAMVFTCPRCGTGVTHPLDALHGFCDRCQAFTGAAGPEPAPGYAQWFTGPGAELLAMVDAAPNLVARVGADRAAYLAWLAYRRREGLAVLAYTAPVGTIAPAGLDAPLPPGWAEAGAVLDVHTVAERGRPARDVQGWPLLCRFLCADRTRVPAGECALVLDTLEYTALAGSYGQPVHARRVVPRARVTTETAAGPLAPVRSATVWAYPDPRHDYLPRFYDLAAAAVPAAAG